MIACHFIVTSVNDLGILMMGKQSGHRIEALQLDITTTWVRRSDKWLVQFHTETPAVPPRAFLCKTFGETVEV